MNHLPNNNALPHEFPPTPDEAVPHMNMAPAPAAVEPVAEQQYDRRGFLSILGKGAAAAVVAKASIDLTAPEVANADPKEPVDVDELLEQLEGLPPEEQEELIDSILENLDADTKLNEGQLKELEKGPPPTPVPKVVGGIVTEIASGLAVLGGLGGGWVLLRRHFKDKKAEQHAREEALRIEKEAQHQREDASYKETVELVIDKLENVSTGIDLSKNNIIPNYEPLVTTYGLLETFAINPRFAARVTNLTVSLLRGRAKAILKMHPDQIEARMNADRQVMHFLAMAHPNLPRQDAKGSPTLPTATGISFDGTRFLRVPLERLDLEGAWMRHQVITGSLAGSRLRHAHFEGSTFGELEGDTEGGGICDLRGTDLSRADLKGAHFEHVLIDEHTRFGEGVEGDPRATFGTVIAAETMTERQKNEKLAAAQAVIDTWSPSGAARDRKISSLVQKLLGALDIDRNNKPKQQ